MASLELDGYAVVDGILTPESISQVRIKLCIPGKRFFFLIYFVIRHALVCQMCVNGGINTQVILGLAELEEHMQYVDGASQVRSLHCHRHLSSIV